MKRKGIIKLKRKAKSWLGLMVYRQAKGSAESKSFSGWLRDIYNEVITNKTIDETRDAIQDIDFSQSESQPKSILHSERMQWKLRCYLDMLSQQEMIDDGEGSCNSTIGDIVNQWASLTDQDGLSLQLKIYPKVKELISKWQQDTGYSEMTRDAALAHPEKVSDFRCALYTILLEETPDEKLKPWAGEGNRYLRIFKDDPRLQVRDEALSGASTMMTSIVEKRIGNALLASPAAKECINHPEYGALAEKEAKKYDWNSKYEQAFAALNTHLQAELDLQGINVNEKSSSFAVSRVGRRNLLANLLDALEEKLHLRFLEAIRNFLDNARNRIQSFWEMSPSGSSVTRDSVRDWLFRREE